MKELNSYQRFRSVERRVVEIINAATGSDMRIDEGKESVDMCLAIQEMREESRLEGKIEGKIEGAITFAKELGIPRDEVKKSFMAKYEKSDEEAERLMKIYWR